MHAKPIVEDRTAAVGQPASQAAAQLAALTTAQCCAAVATAVHKCRGGRRRGGSLCEVFRVHLPALTGTGWGRPASASCG